MSRGGAMPSTSPTAWAYFNSGDCTIRWQRGDEVAYVFEGRRLETYPDERLRVEVLATIPVSSNGWSDMADVRRAGENWVKARRQRCKVCGVVS
jgi:hypothetical protein